MKIYGVRFKAENGIVEYYFDKPFEEENQEEAVFQAYKQLSEWMIDTMFNDGIEDLKEKIRYQFIDRKCDYR